MRYTCWDRRRRQSQREHTLPLRDPTKKKKKKENNDLYTRNENISKRYKNMDSKLLQELHINQVNFERSDILTFFFVFCFFIVPWFQWWPKKCIQGILWILAQLPSCFQKFWRQIRQKLMPSIQNNDLF